MINILSRRKAAQIHSQSQQECGRAVFLFFSFFFFKSLPVDIFSLFLFIFIKDFIYIFLEKGEQREKERERNVNVWLPLARPLLGTWPATQACALTGNRTSDPSFCSPVLNPLSHTSQGFIAFKERGREREREKHQCESEASIGYLPFMPGLGLNSQPRYIPCPGIEPSPFQLCMMLQPAKPHWPGPE